MKWFFCHFTITHVSIFYQFTIWKGTNSVLKLLFIFIGRLAMWPVIKIWIILFSASYQLKDYGDYRFNKQFTFCPGGGSLPRNISCLGIGVTIGIGIVTKGNLTDLQPFRETCGINNTGSTLINSKKKYMDFWQTYSINNYCKLFIWLSLIGKFRYFIWISEQCF